MSDSSDSEGEIFYPVNQIEVNQLSFTYDDPLAVSGVLRAVVENDLEKIKDLISDGKSPNINDNHGNTPLHAAVVRHLSDILDYLLSLEATQVNVRNFYGETPLFLASKLGNFELVEKLILGNANVNLCNYDDVTPLHIAVKYPEIAHLLIKNGANVDARDYSGETPMHEAVNENCLETLCMLLFYNADANMSCDNNITAFMKSIIFELTSMQMVLIDYVTDFNATTKDGMSTLNLALTHLCVYLEEIIERGADVNTQHEHMNAFSICVQFPSKSSFRAIWPHFKYQPLYDDLTYLELMVLHLSSLDLNDYLSIIIESGNLEPIFRHFNFTHLYKYLNERVNTNKKYWLDIVSDLICLYLCEGNTLYGDHISELYDLFGYTELLRICLHMDICMRDCTNLSMGLLLYDFTKTVDELKSSLFQTDVITHIKPFLPHIRITSRVNVSDGDNLSLEGIPSLLELARNATRDHLVNKFDLNVSKKYYLFVQNMCINRIYKDMLTFKKAIYRCQLKM